MVPAALGATLTPQAVPALRCRAIVGPANNQLVDDSVADLLHAHGITWAPDPVVSAGGIVASVAREISHLTEPEVQNLLAAIGDRLGALLDESARNGQPPLTVARQRLRRRLTQAQASAAPHPAVATARQPSPPQGDRLPPASTVLTAAHRGHNPQPSRRTNKAREGAPVTGNPSLEWIEVTIDCIDVEAVSKFWCHLLGVNRVDDPLPGWARAAATVPSGPVLNFQPVPDPKAGKSRVHLDLRTDDLPAAIRRVGALGGACTGEVHIYKEGTVAVMTDPEGTEFCLTGPPGSATDC